ncbi:hypothetical protein K8I28_00630 [bacterium]|nr:hypothetical protein [bacterium]
MLLAGSAEPCRRQSIEEAFISIFIVPPSYSSFRDYSSFRNIRTVAVCSSPQRGDICVAPWCSEAKPGEQKTTPPRPGAPYSSVAFILAWDLSQV